MDGQPDTNAIWHKNGGVPGANGDTWTEANADIPAASHEQKVKVRQQTN